MKKYIRLQPEELQYIFKMREKGKSIREISKALGRSTSTISEAINKYIHCSPIFWDLLSALRKARYVFKRFIANRLLRGKKKRLSDPVVKEYVLDKLINEHWSPIQIEVRIGLDHPGKSITAKTIYNYIKQERQDLREYLRERGKPRRQRVAHRRSLIRRGAPRKTYIEERPEVINQRIEVGHWEGDTIVSCKGGSGAILSLRERKTRNRYLVRLPNLKSEIALGALRGFFHNLPPHMRKSITFDNGAEFGISEMIKLERVFSGFKVYYCESYQSWQKGSVENANREVREYHPKGTDFSTVAQADIKSLQQKLNRRPMVCLDGLNAGEAFQLEMSSFPDKFQEFALAA